jgi:hypothetical protein
MIPSAQVTGYDYSSADQPYHLEVWIEKSTMNDVLVPICQRHHVDLIVGTGNMSITSVVDLLKRSARHAAAGMLGTRVFYISDFDRAGDAMPRQVSRQIEFWHGRYAPAADIRLLPIVLTAKQVDRYNLPNRMGESAGHNHKFEERQQRGVVELDALEALFPGELGRIVEEAITPYVDTELRAALEEAEQEAEDTATRLWDEQTEPLRQELVAIAGETDAIVTQYQTELVAIGRRITEELQPYEVRLTAIEAAIREQQAVFAPELPERPAPDPIWDNDVPWLFDSSRGQLDQLDAYRRHTAGSDEES